MRTDSQAAGLLVILAATLFLLGLVGCSSRTPQRHEQPEVFVSPMDEMDFAYEAELVAEWSATE
jgi:hypothetical protein